MSSKRILVIGGTGAQGAAVVEALREADQPYTIRILTRDPEHPRARELAPAGSGVELFKGSFMDTEAVRLALQDCYGVFVNTDSFTVKEADEIWAAMRIFEIAKWVPTVRHLVWSGLEYYLKLGNYNPIYGSYHINAKARVNDWLSAQPSSTADDGLAWSILNTGPYTEQLYGGSFVPQIQRDGTRVFSLPLGTGRLPLIALRDIGVFARLLFSDRGAWSGRALNAMSCFASGAEIAETTARVARVSAVYEPCSFREWAARIPWTRGPVAETDPDGPTSAANLQMWWKAYEDDLLGTEIDLEALRRLHPGLRSLETWMREVGYDGTTKPLLKRRRDGSV